MYMNKTKQKVHCTHSLGTKPLYSTEYSLFTSIILSPPFPYHLLPRPVKYPIISKTHLVKKVLKQFAQVVVVWRLKEVQSSNIT